MAGRDELAEVGLEVSFGESMVQDDTPMQEDISPQPNPEGVLGVAGAAYDTPLSVKFPPRPLADPCPTEANQLRQDHFTRTGWGKWK